MKIKTGSYWFLKEGDRSHQVVVINAYDDMVVYKWFGVLTGTTRSGDLICDRKKDDFRDKFEPLNRLEVAILFGEYVDED